MSNVAMKRRISKSHARSCITCNSHTIEDNQYRTNNSKSFQVNFTDGLCCSLCNRFICTDCIHLFHSKINPSKHKSQYHPDMFPLIDMFSSYTSTDENDYNKEIKSYIGHCCLLKHKSKENTPKRLKSKHDVLESTTKKEEENHHQNAFPPSNLNIGGSFVYDQCKLIIPSSFHFFDCFALGSEQNLPPITHYVIDEAYSLSLVKSNNISILNQINDQSQIPSTWNIYFKSVNTKVPHNFQKQKKVSFFFVNPGFDFVIITFNLISHLYLFLYLLNNNKFNIAVIEVPILNEKSMLPKGNGTIENLKDHFYFDVDSFVKNHNKKYPTRSGTNQINIVLIATKQNSFGLQNLLLLRFYNFTINEMKDKKKNALFDHFLSMLDNKRNHKNYIERKREGGAQGTTEYKSSVLFKMLHTSNSSPRCSIGTIWLRLKNNRKWKIFYRGTQDGVVHDYYYSSPRIGGQFELDCSLFKKYTFLLEFLSTKPYTALIVESLELQHKISPMAIQNELENMKETHEYVFGKTMMKKKDTIVKPIIQYYERYSKIHNRYTLVTHPVGRHNDVFDSNKTSKLENRFCMSISDFRPTSVKKKNFSTYGRGGNGTYNFVFAILDW